LVLDKSFIHFYRFFSFMFFDKNQVNKNELLDSDSIEVEKSHQKNIKELISLNFSQVTIQRVTLYGRLPSK